MLIGRLCRRSGVGKSVNDTSSPPSTPVLCIDEDSEDGGVWVVSADTVVFSDEVFGDEV